MKRKVVIYLPDLSGGGAERLHVRLAPLLVSAGYEVTLLLDRHHGELLEQVPKLVRVESLDADRQLKAVLKLASYLKRVRPDLLIANMEHMNVMAIVARALSGVPTRIIVTQHNAFSEQVDRPSLKYRILPLLYRLVLPKADGIVAVSAGVASDLATRSGLDRARVTVIYNGVVTDDFDERATSEAPAHPWYAAQQPIVVAMGRLVSQKDFPNLIRAFAMGSAQTDARLLILGEGPMRSKLETLAASLGVSARVSMPGFVANPLPYLAAARLFVLSSRFEGFGNVIAEALACGTPVVSTNCPHGPAEILENGRFGTLVPVGDPEELGRAILAALELEPEREKLRERGRVFSMKSCAASYLKLIG